MAVLIPPKGGRPSLVLDKEEALSLLALLSMNPRYWNNDLRVKLAEYIDRLPDDAT
jgi:hypothetical protein